MAVLCVGCAFACDVGACMCNWWGVIVELAGVNFRSARAINFVNWLVLGTVSLFLLFTSVR